MPNEITYMMTRLYVLKWQCDVIQECHEKIAVNPHVLVDHHKKIQKGSNKQTYLKAHERTKLARTRGNEKQKTMLTLTAIQMT
eukprot:5920669-Amphidinium_carterae.1